MTDEQLADGLSEAGKDYTYDGAHDALNRMKRAHERGTGCRLTADMLNDLYVTIIGQMWDETDPRTILTQRHD